LSAKSAKRLSGRGIPDRRDTKRIELIQNEKEIHSARAKPVFFDRERQKEGLVLSPMGQRESARAMKARLQRAAFWISGPGALPRLS
jgi:hypothetical protein